MTGISLLQHQLGRVCRRLFLRVLGRRLALGAAAALLVASLGLLLVASGHLRSDPSPLSEALRRLVWIGAALALDRDCRLKERATTCLCLTAEQRSSPAGQALLDDANRHAARLALAVFFPLRPSRIGALVAPSALLALLAALFCEPAPLPQGADTEDATAALSQPQEVKSAVVRGLGGRPVPASGKGPDTAAQDTRIRGPQSNG
jgi:hypothetical protein